jgi:hypothetical protein
MIDNVVEEGPDVASSYESSRRGKVGPFVIEFAGGKVDCCVVILELVDTIVKSKNTFGDLSGLGFIKSILSSEGIFGGTACTIDDLVAGISKSSYNLSGRLGETTMTVLNSSDLGEETLVMCGKTVEVLRVSINVSFKLDGLEGLIDDNLLEEWNDSNLLLKNSLLLFKIRDLLHVKIALDLVLFVLIHELLNPHLVTVDFAQSLLVLVVVVF